MSLKGGTFVVNELNKVLKRIDELKEYAVELLKELIRAKAVNPSFGGPGEYRRGKYLKEVLSELGLKVTSYDVKDERAEGGIRPNIIATLKGQEERKLWLVSHLDTVPEGDRGLWSSDPYEPLMIGDKIYGRGSEDNCQAIVSSILVAKALIDSNITPKLSLGLIMASDEEAGSKYGIERVLDELKPVNKGDLIVVPDAGEPNGDFIEVAEKSILWFKVITLGKQGHASLPSEA
ncbi:MAG: diaminopimelate aminotransferase, partial [Thermofilum sp. ex4484_15]